MARLPWLMGASLSALLLLVPARPAHAHDIETTYLRASGKLAVKDPGAAERRRVVFKGAWEISPGFEIDDPGVHGATLRLAPGAGTTIALPAPFWRGLGRPAGTRGYRYRDPAGSMGGVRTVVLKTGKRRGRMKVVARGALWPHPVASLRDGFTLTLSIGEMRWCSDFRTPFKRSTDTRVRARSSGGFTSTWAAIQEVLFAKQGCTSDVCHGAAGEGGLDLRPDAAHAALVDVFSPLGQMARVEPGDEERSFLWRKLAKATLGLDAVPGTAMPSGLPPVPADQLDALKIWIRAGAPATGVVGGTESLLASCLPPADPIKIRAPAPPAVTEGVQLHAPPWEIAAQGEDEVCYATAYDFSAQIPAALQAPCPEFWGGPARTCFFYKRAELTQDPNSHHSIIHLYNGAFAVDDPAANFGPFTCRGGPTPGLPCDPLGAGTPAPAGADCGPGGGCAGRLQSTVACIGYGPPDFGFSLSGSGTPNAPTIGGSQAPLSSDVYPPGVFAALPVSGVVVWNSHAFNLTDAPTTNEQWFNLYFAAPEERLFPVENIFNARDIFVQDVPPFEQREYCRTHNLPRGTRLFQLSSHTHKRGMLFRVWGPGVAERCSSQAGDACGPEPGPPVLTTVEYNDPAIVRFDPPLELDGNGASRRLKFCALYDNGATNPEDVKRRSTSPVPPLEFAPGGPCGDEEVACLNGPRRGDLCQGNHAVCDSAPGLGDGLCDACPLRGGVTTEDEMFILLGLYYRVPTP